MTADFAYTSHIPTARAGLLPLYVLCRDYVSLVYFGSADATTQWGLKTSATANAHETNIFYYMVLYLLILYCVLSYSELFFLVWNSAAGRVL